MNFLDYLDEIMVVFSLLGFDPFFLGLVCFLLVRAFFFSLFFPMMKSFLDLTYSLSPGRPVGLCFILV